MGVWDDLDESEISRPEILFQSAPARDAVIQAMMEVEEWEDFLLA